ncbi:MAG TPA: hypothetical protein PLX23_07530 [Candidatus Hydrogenedens sp.]|nr:hypothetical protein [Candidatus Hydrogenedens sp.]
MKKDLLKKSIQGTLKAKTYKDREEPFRNTVLVSQHFLEQIPNSQSLWHETPEEIERKLQWGKEKAHLLQWIQKQIQRKLTVKERNYIELYYFQGLTLELISKKYHSNPANISRTIRRGIKKLVLLTKNEEICFQRVHMRQAKGAKQKSSHKTDKSF